jgi:ankyrin repeat protein
MAIFLINITDLIQNFERPIEFDINEVVSRDETRDSNLKKLVEIFKFWEKVIPESDEITPQKIQEALISIGDYFENVFKNNQEILDVARLMLKDSESKFFKSIKDFKDANLIEIIKNYVFHSLTLAQIIEKSSEADLADNLEKVAKNLLIFPGRQITTSQTIQGITSQVITTDNDFVCLAGSFNRINDARRDLLRIPFHQQIIEETIQKNSTYFEKFARAGNIIHVPKTTKSLLTLQKVDDDMFYSPDTDMTSEKVQDFFKNFIKKVSENISKELDEYCDQIINAKSYDKIKSLKEQFKSRFDFELQDQYLFKNFDIDFENLESENFFKKDQIKAIVEKQLIASNPAIYCNNLDDVNIKKDALYFLSKLDIYFDNYPFVNDPSKIENLVNLLLPSQQDPDRDTKIEAGLIFLHFLARDFKESDPVFFLMVVEKLSEKILLTDEETVQNFNPLDAYFHRLIPDELKSDDRNTSKIIDYVKAKKVERSRALFVSQEGNNLGKISFENYKNFLLTGEINPDDDVTYYYNLMINSNHFSRLKKEMVKDFDYKELILDLMLDRKNNTLLKNLMIDQEDNQKINPENINKILIYAVENNQPELLSLAIKRGGEINQNIDWPLFSNTPLNLLRYAYKKKFPEISLILINASDNLNKDFDKFTIYEYGKDLLITKNYKIFDLFLKKLTTIDSELIAYAIKKELNEIAILMLGKIKDLNKEDLNKTSGFLEGLSPLSYAIKHNNSELAIALIDNGAEVNATDSVNGFTFLQSAIGNLSNSITNSQTDIANQQIKIVLAIINKFDDIGIIDPEIQKNIFKFAIEKQQSDIALALIEKGAEIDLTFDGLDLPNFVVKNISDSKKAFEIIKKLFEKNPDFINKINIPLTYSSVESISDSYSQLSLFLRACIYGKPEIVEYLLEHSAPENKPDLNAKNPKGLTPIMSACQSYGVLGDDKLKIVNLLIDAGADLKIVDNDGNDISRYALKIQGSSELLKSTYPNRSLCQKIKDRLLKKTPLLHQATIEGNLECVKFLYEQAKGNPSLGCFPCYPENPLEVKDLNTQSTPLLFAIEKNDFECVEFFINNQANVNCRNKANETPIYKALNKLLNGIDLEIFGQFYSQEGILFENSNSYKIIKKLTEANYEIDEKSKILIINFTNNYRALSLSNSTSITPNIQNAYRSILGVIGPLLPLPVPMPVRPSLAGQVVQRADNLRSQGQNQMSS